MTRRKHASTARPTVRRRPTKARARAAALCPVVGIGASAGGFDAFKRFFQAMPPDSDMAFVLIQHLDPTRDSLTAELVGKSTTMRVVQVKAEMAVEPHHVYVIPPNRYLSISQRTLRLSAPAEPRGLRTPIDFFLRSLATDLRELAIGIILSGTGTDGTLGLKEVKGAGGLAIVQDPSTAQFDGMPQSAIATGVVDYVLPPERMPDVLVKYVGHAYIKGAVEAPAADEAPDQLQSILALLRTRGRFDFSCYKQGTLRRRIHRRMSLKHVEALADYAQVLRGDPDEVTALFRDLLIGVAIPRPGRIFRRWWSRA